MLLLFITTIYTAEFYHVKIKSITYCKFSLAHSQRIQSLTPVMSEFLYLAVGLMEHFLEGIAPLGLVKTLLQEIILLFVPNS